MRALALSLALCLTPLTARADLSSPSTGVYVDLGAGLGAADAPFRPTVGWHVAVGGWFGRYDDTFSVGRHIGLGLSLRQDLQLHAGARELRTYPLIELRRGIDLLVAGLRFGVVAGPVMTTPLDGGQARLDGATVRLVGGATYRFAPRYNAYVRVEAGIDAVDVVQPALGFLVGVELTIPRTRDGAPVKGTDPLGP